jgi:hypothetical protein
LRRASFFNSLLDGTRAESIDTATIDEDGRVTAWSGTVRTQTLVERVVFDPAEVWHRIAEIAQALTGAQQTTTTRERPEAPVVRRPGVAGMRATFHRTRVPASMLFNDFAAGLPLTESWRHIRVFPVISRSRRSIAPGACWSAMRRWISWRSHDQGKNNRDGRSGRLARE